VADLLRKGGGVEVMEFASVLTSLEKPCPTPTLMIALPTGFAADESYGRQGLRLNTDAATQYEGGGCADLRAGTKLRIAATRLGHRLDKNGQSWNGSLDVVKIRIDPK
jgi:hypothetical protein